jgi:hypothetical protein
VAEAPVAAPQARLEPSPLGRDVPRSAAPTSEPAPTVRVTIGRIEVRAAPPTPVVATARRGPALSLKDYLVERREGRR